MGKYKKIFSKYLRIFSNIFSKCSVNIYEYLRIFTNIYEYLQIFTNIYKYLQIFTTKYFILFFYFTKFQKSLKLHIV